jgi:hypothetical protein
MLVQIVNNEYVHPNTAFVKTRYKLNTMETLSPKLEKHSQMGEGGRGGELLC